ncbi:MAG: hypothetical protein AABX71_01770 [Nanoarchaeota archaeon]
MGREMMSTKTFEETLERYESAVEGKDYQLTRELLDQLYENQFLEYVKLVFERKALKEKLAEGKKASEKEFMRVNAMMRANTHFLEKSLEAALNLVQFQMEDKNGRNN